LVEGKTRISNSKEAKGEVMMEIQKRTIVMGVLAFVAFFGWRCVYGRSVFAITRHQDSVLTAYNINGEAIEYQIDGAAVPDQASGAVGLALDPDSSMLFVTYEGWAGIEIVNAKTMEYEGNSLDTADAAVFAGVIYDAVQHKVYALERGSNKLFVYLWNPVDKSLITDGNNPKTLGNMTYAYGVALDESRNRVFATEATNIVRYYDTNDPNFGYLGSIEISVDGYDREAIGITFDANSNCLYTGSFTGMSGDHTYLVRTDINDINNPVSTEKDVGWNVIGLTVDEKTGFLYVTDHNEDIRVFNTNTWPSDPCYIEDANISAPADIIVRYDVSYKPSRFGLLKSDDANDCAEHYSYFTYTIAYDANGYDSNDVVITDYLPIEVDFNSASDGGVYDAFERVVRWDIGDVNGGDWGSVSLSVRINEFADPGRGISNSCDIESDRYYTRTSAADVNVCCWGDDRIYVDVRASGHNTGRSWDDAYRDLQDALTRAAKGCGSEIWVAEGLYFPTSDEDDDGATFEMIDGVELYGGFAGNESTVDQRDYVKNSTVLTGVIGGEGDDSVTYVVSVVDMCGVVIDGFSIEDGSSSAIYVEGSSVTIRNSSVIKNYDRMYGVYSKDSACSIVNCVVGENEFNGMYCGDGGTLTVEKSIVRNNPWVGIECSGISSVSIVGSVVHNNGYGIVLNSISSEAVVGNSTIVDNDDYGIGAWSCTPDISNCIVWGNGDDLYGCSATYSCIENLDSGDGNIHSDPVFYDDPCDANDYHLWYGSPCIDAGDTEYVDSNGTDIDGEERVMDGDGDGSAIVDMGADEYYWSVGDLSGDGIENFIDYAVFALA